MKLQDGMVVKRKDNGLKGVAHKLKGVMWRVKYYDGTHTYTTESAFKNNFVIPELEVNFEDSKCDGVEPKTIEVLFADYEPTNDSKYDGVEPETGLIDKQPHYTNNGIQPIEIMKANMSREEFHGFLLANVWKYTMRYKDKNGLQDIRKAKTYLTWLEADIEERGL